MKGSWITVGLPLLWLGGASGAFVLLDPDDYRDAFVDGAPGGSGEVDEAAFAWAREQVPFFAASDAPLQAAYYYRWKAFHSHLIPTGCVDNAWVVSECYPWCDWNAEVRRRRRQLVLFFFFPSAFASLLVGCGCLRLGRWWCGCCLTSTLTFNRTATAATPPIPTPRRCPPPPPFREVSPHWLWLSSSWSVAARPLSHLDGTSIPTPTPLPPAAAAVSCPSVS